MHNYIVGLRYANPTYQALDTRLKLRINDISIVNGGIFDVNGDWQNPHVGHYVGVQVDIARDAWNSRNTWDNTERVNLNSPITIGNETFNSNGELWDTLLAIINNYADDTYDHVREEGGDHIHIEFQWREP